MKKTFIYILFVMLASTLSAATPEQLMEQGNKAYESKNYQEAINTYQDILHQGYASHQLYYNLGNAHFRMGDYAHAILFYERALRINPTDAETLENLELAQSRTQDQIEEIPQFLVVRLYKSMLRWLSPTGWLIATLILAAIALSAIVVLIISSSYQTRKWSFVIAAAALLAALLAGANAWASYSRLQNHDEAIVMPTMISVKSSPEEGGIEKFILHSGTKVEITDELNDWYKIVIADGEKGWLHANEIERI